MKLIIMLVICFIITNFQEFGVFTTAIDGLVKVANMNSSYSAIKVIWHAEEKVCSLISELKNWVCRLET